MDLEKMLSNIDANTKADLQASKDYYKAQPTEALASPEPVDVYQRNKDRLYDISQKAFPKGSSAAVNMATTAVVDGVGAEGLAKAYKRAKDDSDALKVRGERGRAELVRQQYMQEDFLPAVEIVVNSASPDEVLNSKRALEELDKYTVYLDGNHSLVRIENPAAAGKGKLLVIRDSYANCMGTFLANSYESVVLVDLRYYKNPVSELLAAEEFTDVLVCYSLGNFMTDTNLIFLR